MKLFISNSSAVYETMLVLDLYSTGVSLKPIVSW